MAVKPEESKAALVGKTIEHVRERLSGPQADQVEQFVAAYYADAAPEDLHELDLYGAALAHWQFLQQRQPGRDEGPRLHAEHRRARLAVHA